MTDLERLKASRARIDEMLQDLKAETARHTRYDACLKQIALLSDIIDNDMPWHIESQIRDVRSNLIALAGKILRD